MQSFLKTRTKQTKHNHRELAGIKVNWQDKSQEHQGHHWAAHRDHCKDKSCSTI